MDYIKIKIDDGQNGKSIKIKNLNIKSVNPNYFEYNDNVLKSINI